MKDLRERITTIKAELKVLKYQRNAIQEQLDFLYFGIDRH